MSRSRWPEIAEVIVAFAPSMATAHAHLLAMKIAALYDAALLADTPVPRCDFDCDACRATDDTEGAG